MSNELATVITDLVTLQQALAPTEADKESFEGLVDSRDFLAALRLFGSNSDLCKEGKIPPGHFGVFRGKDQVEDIGPEVDIIPLSHRAKAILIEDKSVTLTSYDQKSDEYAKMRDMADADSACGALHGPEFLCWVPKLKEYVLYHMLNKTSRNEAKNVYTQIGKMCTLYAILIVGKKYKWHGPRVKACNVPPTSLPTSDVVSMINIFKNPAPTQSVEITLEDNTNINR